MTRIIVKGIVQGVGYRYFTIRIASRLGINGYVKNLKDGSVEVITSCEDKEVIEELLKNLKLGPPFSKVQNLVVDILENQEQFFDFDIRY